MRFCEVNNPNEWEWEITYWTLLELGEKAIESEQEDNDKEISINCSNNQTMCDALRENSREFWVNWSIVTGIPLPQDKQYEYRFSCGC